MNRLKTAVPWLASLAIVGWVGASADLDAVAEAVSRADLGPYVVLSVLWAVVNLLIEASFFLCSFRWLAGVGTFREVLDIRAGAYVLTLVSSAAGFGAMVMYMKRVHGTPLRRGIGIMMVESFCELGSMGFLILLAVAMKPVDGTQGLTGIGAGLVAFFAAGVLVTLASRRFRTKTSLFSIFEELSVGQYGALFGIKSLQNVCWGLWVAFTLPLFGVHPPHVVSVGLSQVAHLMRALPISAFGIGVDQLTFPGLFAPWEQTPGSLLAFSVVFTAAVLAARACLGLLFLRPALRRFRS